MKNSLLLFISLWLCSCQPNNRKQGPAPETAIQTGVYTSEKPGYTERILLYMQGHSYVIGSTLVLYKDHSYHMINCGNIAKGHWHTDSGKLFLQMTYNNWRLDSFRKYGFKGRWLEVEQEPMIFRIDNNKLQLREREGKTLFLLQYREHAIDTTASFYQGQ